MPDRGRHHVQPLVPTRMDVTIEGRIGQAELALLVEHVRGLVNAGQADVVCDVVHTRESDLGTVATLARLQLVAHRGGGAISLANASADLHGLLDLVGLCAVIGACRGDLGGEPGGQAEHREEARGVEEEGDAADSVT